MAVKGVAARSVVFDCDSTLCTIEGIDELAAGRVAGTGQEGRTQHADPKAPGEHKGLIYRAPVINIGRNPFWGRNHEAWGEDPYLTGRMAVARGW